jgi:hypothetical protein
MALSSHLETFLNKPVKNYSPDEAIDPDKFVYRLRVDYDDADVTMAHLLDAFTSDPKAGQVKELIIGQYNVEASEPIEEVVAKLVELKDVLKNLKALFLGDITYDECEISWIVQTDITPILQAWPALEHLQTRGGDGLSFSNLQHDQLKTLIIETGGLPPNVIKEVSEARLPNLERLDLWLGSENYGFDSTVEDFSTILSGKNFPKLTHLGLKNSEIQDEIAIAVSQSPILAQLKVLDLSMGTLSNEGAAALLENDAIRNLEHLNLRHHYLSQEMMDQLQTLGISINLDDKENEHEEDRYAEVTE